MDGSHGHKPVVSAAMAPAPEGRKKAAREGNRPGFCRPSGAFKYHCQRPRASARGYLPSRLRGWILPTFGWPPPLLLVLGALVIGFCFGGTRAALPPSDPDPSQFFESKIRPLLIDKCYPCHSAQARKLKGGLFADNRDGLIKGGDSGPAIVPGEPDQSRLIDAVRYGNPDLRMPPKIRLADAQVADLTEWVKRGAPWPVEKSSGTISAKPVFDLQKRKHAHWAWQPIRRQDPPAVKQAGWPRGPIDSFILAKLESAGLSPAPDADRHALIRRVYFDLTGLPPAPRDVQAFVDDSSPRAFEVVVDRLLASPQFGERRARHWLDLVRYAETHGHEFDYPIPNAWRYRDYVVRALNADVPYDQFLTEHLAGDLLDRPRTNPEEGFNESILGTGFWFLGEEAPFPRRYSPGRSRPDEQPPRHDDQGLSRPDRRLRPLPRP